MNHLEPEFPSNGEVIGMPFRDPLDREVIGFMADAMLDRSIVRDHLRKTIQDEDKDTLNFNKINVLVMDDRTMVYGYVGMHDHLLSDDGFIELKAKKKYMQFDFSLDNDRNIYQIFLTINLDEADISVLKKQIRDYLELMCGLTHENNPDISVCTSLGSKQLSFYSGPINSLNPDYLIDQEKKIPVSEEHIFLWEDKKRNYFHDKIIFDPETGKISSEPGHGEARLKHAKEGLSGIGATRNTSDRTVIYMSISDPKIIKRFAKALMKKGVPEETIIELHQIRPNRTLADWSPKE